MENTSILESSENLLLHITDTHLLDKETSTTLKQADNSILMLSEINKFVKENENIVIVTFGGDIQDRVPTKLFYIDMWKKKFKELRDLLLERQQEKGIKIKYIGLTEEQKKLQEKGLLSPLVSSRGNHDYVKTLKRISSKEEDSESNKEVSNETLYNYTFFDSIISENIMINPKAFALKVNGENIYFDNRNFGEADRKLPKKITDKFKVIASYHDNVVTDESSLWQLKSVDLYEAEDVLEGVDLGIVNHIHKNQDPLIIDTKDGKESIMWQIGSMGRMKMNEDETRDVGYSGLISLDNIDDYELIEFDLIPVSEYFDFTKVMKRKNLEKSRKDLNLGTTYIVRNDILPSEEIKGITKDTLDIPDITDDEFTRMKDKAIEILEDLESSK